MLVLPKRKDRDEKKRISNILGNTIPERPAFPRIRLLLTNIGGPPVHANEW